MSDHKDIAQNDIKEGDIVLYAALWDRSATLKFGIITRLESRPPRFGQNIIVRTVRVISVDRDYKDKWHIQAKGKEITLGFTDRLLVVEVNQIPGAALDLLQSYFAERKKNKPDTRR